MPQFIPPQIKPSTTAPSSEVTGGSSGSDPRAFSMGDHRHPRLTSVTKATLDGSGLATVTFTRSFANEPGVVLTAIAPGGTQPVTLQVQSWVQTGANYTGCVVKGYRAQTLPAVIALLSALLNYDIFAGSASGVGVSVIAVQVS